MDVLDLLIFASVPFLIGGGVAIGGLAAGSLPIVAVGAGVVGLATLAYFKVPTRG